MHPALIRFFPALAVCLVGLSGCHASGGSPSAAPSGATTAPITVADLRARLYAYADDSMQGRQTGTIGNVKATDLIAAEAKRLGLEPAGENGGWFQTVPLVRRTLGPEVGIAVDGTTYRAWDDIIPRDQGKGTRPVDGATAIYGGTWDKDLIPLEQAQGKLVVVAFPPENGVPAGVVNRAQTTARFSGAAGIVIATLDDIGPTDRLDLQDAAAQLEGGDGPETPAFFYATRRVVEALLGGAPGTLQPGATGKTVSGTVAFTDTPVSRPGRNVVAILRGQRSRAPGRDGGDRRPQRPRRDLPGDAGTRLASRLQPGDAARGRQQHAGGADRRAAGADPEHPGQSPPGAPGAARLDPQRRRRRWQRDGGGAGAGRILREGQGPAQALAPVRLAHRRGDGTDRLQLVHPAPHRAARLDRGPAQHRHGGSGRRRRHRERRPGLPADHRLTPPVHRAGRLVDKANAEGKHGFTFDYQYDADGHPANYYCRSDHYMYARFGIPIAFFTTGSHRDYHQVTDEVQYIDFEKMAHVTSLVAEVATRVADLDHRVVVDKPKPDPDGVCQQ